MSLINKLSITESKALESRALRLDFDVNGVALPYEFQLWLSELTGLPTRSGTFSFLVPANLFLSRIDDFQALRVSCGSFPIEHDNYFENLITKLKQDRQNLALVRDNPDLRLPPEEVVAKLKQARFLRWENQSPDQLRDIGRLCLLANGANFSVPGSGKTNALLAVYALSKLEDPSLSLLVACPKNAMLAWDEEVAACFGNTHRVTRLQGTPSEISKQLGSNPNFAVISYQRLHGARRVLETFMRSHNVHFVLDESHRIKAGSRSQQGAAALTLANFATRRDILSGTPMPQGFGDLEAQFRFLWPQLDLFRDISADDQVEEQIRKANENIRPYFVRTTKRELGLPKPIIRDVNIEMSATQRQTWELIRHETARYLARLDPQDKDELRLIGKQIMRLLQFCSDPSLLLASLPPGFESGELQRQLEQLSKETSRKMTKLDSLVFQTMSKPGEKVVIWSMFVNQIESLTRRYSKYGATCIHGGVPTGTDEDLAFREARIARFKESKDCRVLVANPSACGEGISLHKEAHHAIYFDRSFNAAHFLQSIDRIHRRGLPEGVHTVIDILCLNDTIEVAVRQRLSDKIKYLKQLLDDEDLSAMVFDPEDVEEFGEDAIVSSSDFEAIMKVLEG